jgi:hypothetical protein
MRRRRRGNEQITLKGRSRGSVKQPSNLFPPSSLVFIQARQLAQRRDHPLPRTTHSADRFDQSPILVELSVLLAAITAQKHRHRSSPLPSNRQQRGLHYIAKIGKTCCLSQVRPQDSSLKNHKKHFLLSKQG